MSLRSAALLICGVVCTPSVSCYPSLLNVLCHFVEVERHRENWLAADRRRCVVFWFDLPNWRQQDLSWQHDETCTK